MDIIGHFINGTINVDTTRTQPVYNPSTGETRQLVALADRDTVTQAVEAAIAAFPAWRDTPLLDRAHIMFKFKQLLEENNEQICELIGVEHGKIYHDAFAELQRGLENVEYACAAPEFLKSEYSKNIANHVDSWSENHPLGIVLGITPFNFPAMVPLWMFPLAIVCGNCFILKPSEKDPSACLFMAQLLQKAGLPNGVFNVVNGDQETVNHLLQQEQINAVSFVGSTEVAQSVYQNACAHGKRCQALGGAKNHAIVMPDADLDTVAHSLLDAAFGSSGERCMALSVAITIGDDIADQLIQRLKQEMTQLKYGHYADKSNHFGPLITMQHKAKVIAYIDSAEQQGANIVVDGRIVNADGHQNGFFIGPTLIDQVDMDMLSYQQEILGPVLQILRVKTLQQAMDLINQHELGNGTCLYTRDGEAARYFSDHINIGMVGINIPLPAPSAYHSFGGWKHSFFGDLSAYGPDGARFYTRRKTITQRWPSVEQRQTPQFAMPSHA